MKFQKTLVPLALFLSIYVNLMGQCPSQGNGTLSATVYGNSVTLHNDTAERNCASWYLMEITQLEGDTLQWIQKEQGGFALCLCYFNISATIDSLNPGDYFVKAYYTTSPEPAWDTCFIGTTSFTITGQNQANNFIVSDTYQSDCFPVGLDDPVESKNITLQVTPNPAQDKITLTTNLHQTCQITLHDGYGKNVIQTESNGVETVLDISMLPAGIYFVKMQNEKSVQVVKFLKK